MTKEQIQKLAEEKAIEAGYPKSDKESFETTFWTQHNIYKKGVVEGYKAAMLQGMEEISMLKKQLSEQRASAVMNEQGLLELNRNVYETSIDDLLSWLKRNHYLPQTEETIQKITDQFYEEKNIKPMLQNKGEWISVDDAIPKVIGRYSKIVKTKTSSGVIIDNRFDDSIKDWQFSFSENITHWHPLPTPPETVTK